MRTLFLYLALLLIPMACKDAVSEDRMITVSKNEEAVEAAVEEVTMEASLPPPPKEEAIMDADRDVSEDMSAEKPLQPKIIKTANLRFETGNLDESFAHVKEALVKYKATVQNDESGKNYESVYRNITLRVPSASFDAFIAEISQGVKHFDRKEISAEDVTEEYIDVEARLKTKRILEKRYFELLAKASKISEMLEIEKELSAIREEIEAKEGRLKYLKNQVSMSTVNLEMYTSNPFQSGATVSYFGKMGNAVKGGFNNIATFFLGMLHVWPFILIFVAGFLFLRRRFRRKTT
ncbi:hypothetical protein FCR2A7T_05260 [Flavobacterium cauense R2A-7]|uniref:Uncharacterized protein DUF4349 n=1 Tax=Flavobacterium cauense R2A-7 TaxID=1341154 RepID=V6S6M9_9FLAO|nr:DUF4349 domain-containing protein [Flavobacterium cauense]ESU22054.1 hypothetical protein FCR2A7T_05260 [Flavobacterium cauense R2A-7]TWI13274.1 uncharacterized protein DUF4349 [Flavobacterium cauense R2A-7]